MRLYYEIALRSYRRAGMYRGAYIAGLITNAFFGALMTFVYRALFAEGVTIEGFNLDDMVTYNWCTQSLISIGGAWITTEIMQTIRSGEVISDLTRPWSFYGYWFSRSVGERVYNLLVRASMTYLIGVIFFGARIPNPVEAAGFLLTMSIAIFISFSLSFIVNLTSFWLIDATGVLLMVNTLLLFFSGFLLPLAFFPPVLAAIAKVLPFQAITSLPAQVFLGKIYGAGLISALLLQLFWAVVLAGLSMLLLRAALHKVVVQGG
jgi:ABC-2 type transport system permease protein